MVLEDLKKMLLVNFLVFCYFFLTKQMNKYLLPYKLCFIADVGKLRQYLFSSMPGSSYFHKKSESKWKSSNLPTPIPLLA